MKLMLLPIMAIILTAFSKNEKKMLLPAFATKNVSGTDNIIYNVEFTFNSSNSLLGIKYYNSNCTQYTAIYYTGSVTAGTNSYFANNVVIQIGGGNTITVNGELVNGVSSCNPGD